MTHPLLYEINTRCWLAELSRNAGRRLTLADVPEAEFDFWQRRGFTHLWLMGVWKLGPRGLAWSRKQFGGREAEFRCDNIAGSPYAITGYAVSRTLGGESALAKFRRKLNARGIGLVLDFIPNHTALDHPWAKTHPAFFVTTDRPRIGTVKPFREATAWFACGACGHGSPWVDTLQLDYRNPELRRAMARELLSVAARCDGVRCDMAMLELNDVFSRTWREYPSAHPPLGDEFWQEALGAVRSRTSEFLFLAEVYWDLEARLQELGFDFTYDKSLYDHLIARNAAAAVSYLESRSDAFLGRSAHFIENHDEPRIASLLSFDEHCAAALLILALPGMRFLHEGQMGGARIHANVHFARRDSEAIDARMQAFYERLLAAMGQTALGRGEWMRLMAQPAWLDNPTQAHVVLLQWQIAPDAFDLAVVNLSAARSQCYARIDVSGLAMDRWRFQDLLGDEVHERDGAELAERGLYLDLPPHAAQLFHSTRIQT